jgi:hypothetical protein
VCDSCKNVCHLLCAKLTKTPAADFECSTCTGVAYGEKRIKEGGRGKRKVGDQDGGPPNKESKATAGVKEIKDFEFLEEGTKQGVEGLVKQEQKRDGSPEEGGKQVAEDLSKIWERGTQDVREPPPA